MLMWCKLILLAVIGLLQDTEAKSLSLSLNVSLALSDDHPGITADVLHNCMRETEISMADLTRFRLGLFSNEPADYLNGIRTTTTQTADEIPSTASTDDDKVVDYDNVVTPVTDDERNVDEESLQCFAHCLYEKLGVIKDGVFVEPDFFRKFYTIVEKGHQNIYECLHLESNNNCEAAYKMHLCYNKLKTIDAEQRIREILKRNDNYNANENYDDADDDDAKVLEESNGELNNGNSASNEVDRD